MRSSKLYLAMGVAVLIATLVAPSQANAQRRGGGRGGFGFPFFFGPGIFGPAFGDWGSPGVGGWGGQGYGGWGGYGGGSYAWASSSSSPAYSFSYPTMVYSIYADPGAGKNMAIPGFGYYSSTPATATSYYRPANYYYYPAGYQWWR